MSFAYNNENSRQNIIDSYIKNGTPLALLDNITYEEMILIIEKIKEFSKIISNDNTNNLSLYGAYGSIMNNHNILDNDRIIELFKRLNQIKKTIPKDVDEDKLHMLELQVALLKAKLDSYDIKTRLNIELFVREEDISKLDENNLESVLKKYGLSLNIFPTVGDVYDYISEQSSKVALEQELVSLQSHLKLRNQLLTEQQKIKDELSKGNMWLVDTCIKYFFKNLPLDFEEVIGFGIEGLSIAIDNYKIDKNFQAFALSSILNNVFLHFQELTGMSWNAYKKSNETKQYRSIMKDVSEEKDMSVTASDLVSGELLSLLRQSIRAKLLEDSMANVEIPVLESHSDMRKMNDEDIDNDEEIIDIEDGYNLEEDIIRKWIIGDILRETLTPKEIEIVRARFLPSRNVSIQELASRFKMSPSTISKVLHKAIIKIRERYELYDDLAQNEHYNKDDFVYIKLLELLEKYKDMTMVYHLMNENGYNWSLTTLLDKIFEMTTLFGLAIGVKKGLNTYDNVLKEMKEKYNLDLSKSFLNYLVKTYPRVMKYYVNSFSFTKNSSNLKL